MNVRIYTCALKTMHALFSYNKYPARKLLHKVVFKEVLGWIITYNNIKRQ